MHSLKRSTPNQPQYNNTQSLVTISSQYNHTNQLPVNSRHNQAKNKQVKYSHISVFIFDTTEKDGLLPERKKEKKRRRNKKQTKKQKQKTKKPKKRKKKEEEKKEKKETKQTKKQKKEKKKKKPCDVSSTKLKQRLIGHKYFEFTIMVHNNLFWCSFTFGRQSTRAPAPRVTISNMRRFIPRAHT